MRSDFRRFLLVLLGFCSAVLTYLFTPGQWLHRVVALALCGVLTTDQVCLPPVSAPSHPGGAVAAVPGDVPDINPQLAAAWERWLAQRANEFDDDPNAPIPSGNPAAPPFPYDPGPNQPLRSPDFDEVSVLQEIFNQISQDPILSRTLGGIPQQICYMAQSILDQSVEAAKADLSYNPIIPGGGIQKSLDAFSEGVDRLLRGFDSPIYDNAGKLYHLNTVRGLIKSQVRKMVLDRLSEKTHLNLNCSQYNHISENFDVCNLCSYNYTRSYQLTGGRYASGVYAPCDAGIQQVIQIGNQREREFTNRSSNPDDFGFVLDIPQRVTNPDPSCHQTATNAYAINDAAHGAANEINEIKICQVPQEFWKSHKRIIGPVNMEEANCVVPGSVMTDEGMVDGSEWCGVCSRTGNNTFGQPPDKRPCSQPEDPARRNPVPSCPGNWSGQ